MIAMPNSVAVLEDFYGEQISPELIQRIRNTPYDQLLVLADRMVTYNRSLERAKLRPYMVSSGKPSDQFERNQVFLWDDIYFKSPGKYSLSESPYFKYALMYTDRIVVPDLSLDWAEELIWGEARGYAVDIEAAGSWLADEVRGLLPVAPLVREGVLITAPSCDNLDTCQRDHRFTLGTRCMELDYPIHSTFSDVFFDDPYLAWIFINSMNVERWELEALDLHRPEDIQDAAYHFLGRQEGPAAGKVSDAYRTAYGPHVRLNDIRDAVMLNLAYREANLVPMTSSSIGRTHLTRSAKVVMEFDRVGRC